MKKYIKIYLETNKFEKADFIPCENCGATAVDIHHIKAKGMGGSKILDTKENLIALCRDCHLTAHQHAEFNEQLRKKNIKKWKLISQK